MNDKVLKSMTGRLSNFLQGEADIKSSPAPIRSSTNNPAFLFLAPPPFHASIKERTKYAR